MKAWRADEHERERVLVGSRLLINSVCNLSPVERAPAELADSVNRRPIEMYVRPPFRRV